MVKGTEMLNDGNDIEYIKGLCKYLPDNDSKNLQFGMRCWYLVGNKFIPVDVLNLGNPSSSVTGRLLKIFAVGTCNLYSDKTLAEAIEKLAIEKSNKNLEMTMKEEQSQFDSVKKPKHYMLFPEEGIEVRDLVKLLLNRASANGYSSPMFLSDQAQMLQYILRFDAKNGKEDLEKARWYLDKMIESLINNTNT